MFLGFTKHGISSRSHSRLITTVISLSVVTTLTTIFLMFDSFFLQLPQIRSVVSPLQNQDVQNCVMSYSYPTFHEVNSPNSPFSQKYNLYLYREGHLDKPDHLYGAPVLFIPGQAGSYKQVRSLASATTHLAYNQHSAKNMDFFTVDLNEELSALSGQTLLDQAEYMNSVIERILSLYDHKYTSVIIVGHSMGGVVARTMFMLPNYIPNSIETIITLATPHLTAPLLLDPIISTIYNDMTQYWTSNREALKNVTIISIAGGSLDNIIHSDGVNIESFIPKTHGFTTYTTSIPGVWTGADHMAILWCNQLIQLLAETLHGYLKLGDHPTVKERMGLFSYYLLNGKDNSIIKNQRLRSSEFRQHDSSNLDEHPSYNLYFDETETQEHIFISNTSNLQFITNIDTKSDHCWALAICTKNDEGYSCDYVEPDVRVIPSASATNLVGSTPYRLLHIGNVNENSYIGLSQQCQIRSADDRPFIQVHKAPDQPTFHMNSVWDIILKGLVINVDPYHSHHVFKAIRNSLFAFDVRIVSIQDNPHAQYKPMMEQRINNKPIKYYRGLEENVSNRITFPQDKQYGLSLVFFTDNQDIKVQIKFDWYGTLGRCVLRYGAIIANYFWITTLIVLLTQVYSYAVNGKREFVAYPTAFIRCLKGAYLQLFLILLCVGGAQYMAPSSGYLHLVFSKYALFASDDWLLIVVLVLAFGISIGLTAIAWLLVKILVSMIGTVLKVILKSRAPNSNSSVDRERAKSRFMLYSASTVGLIRVVPPSALFAFYFVIWFLLTCSAHTKSDLPVFQNVYRYRQTILIFLISFLPYQIPQLIVYVKDILIGWPYHPSYSMVMLVQDLPIVFLLIYLITFGKNPDNIDLKVVNPLVYIMNGLILYQLVFGFLNPFIQTLLPTL